MFKYSLLQNEMTRNAYSILFYLRKSKRDPDTGTIYTRLTLNGEKIELCCTGIKTFQKDFDPKKQKLKNQVLDNKLRKLYSDIIYLIENTENPDCEKVRNLLLGKSEMNPSLLSVMGKYMEYANNEMAYNTMRDWKAKTIKLEKYLKYIKNSNLEARWFNIKAFSQFKTWLIKTENNTENSANKYGVKIRKALKWATMQGMISSNPLSDCLMPIKYQDDLTHLEWNWVEKLREYQFDSKLKKAVDMYIFSCCTGICYADMINLRQEHLENDKELGLIITNRRQKVKSVYVTPLWGYAKEIYNEFGSLENIPKLSNQKVNDYIKIALHKINYPNADAITFHTGRKTFVNYCLNDKLIPPHIVMTYTGHKDIREIEAYGKVKKKIAIKIFLNK